MISDSKESAASPAAQAQQRLMRDTMRLMRPVVRWAVGRGLGYAAVSRWLKPLFLQEARRALELGGIESTDSALALTAGLHRGDVHQLGAQPAEQLPLATSLPVTHQVLANWLLWGLPEVMPFKSPYSQALRGRMPRSFVHLVQRTPKAASLGFSASLILQDMLRLGLVSALPGDRIQLLVLGHGPQTDEQDTPTDAQVNGMQVLFRSGHPPMPPKESHAPVSKDA